MMKNIFKKFKKDEIGEPPWDYEFIYYLHENEYPKYLKKIFEYRTGDELPLKYDFKLHNWIIDKKRCKTFNQKIQWIKLYGITDLMRDCTDKVKVRDYVREKIGAEYLKPLLQVIPGCHCEDEHSEAELCTALPVCERRSDDSGSGRNDSLERKQFQDSEAIQPIEKNEDVTTYFDKINWEKLPNSFVIKCSHGCKWHYIIKNKEEYLNTPRLFYITRGHITGYLEQEFWCYYGFEMQYKGIEPKILIEPLLRENINTKGAQIQVYCFNGLPKLFIKFHAEDEVTLYDENLNITEDLFNSDERKVNIKADEFIKQTVELSKSLSKDFLFVRVDWMIYQNKLYFEELTFTPYSGFYEFKDRNAEIKLGNLIKL